MIPRTRLVPAWLAPLLTFVLIGGACAPRPDATPPAPPPEAPPEQDPGALPEKPPEEPDPFVEEEMSEPAEPRGALRAELGRITDPDAMLAAITSTSTVLPAPREPTAERIDQLARPPGFQIEIVAEGLDNPRIIEVSEEGHIYVAEREAGRVTLLRVGGEGGEPDRGRPVATGLGEGLGGVHGLASRDGYLWMVTERELYVAQIMVDGALGEPERVLDDLPDGGQHPNRAIRWGPDGMLYLSIGSTCNACVEPNEEHATLLRIAPSTGAREIFARGLRNTIGFAWHPRTGEMYGLDHNSDERGNDWPTEELNRIEEGGHYGWPHCWGDRQVDALIPADPPGAESREAFCGETAPPVLEYPGHAAPMQLTYYEGFQFPPEYRGDAFATMRGSWNRNPPVGYEVVRIVHDAEGRPTAIEPFVSGWLFNGGRAHFGRLTGLAVAPDGSLLVGDDENGVVYRIWHEVDVPGDAEPPAGSPRR